MRSAASIAFALAATAAARDMPANIKAFYDANLKGECTNPISKGYSNGQSGSKDVVYCQEPKSGAIFLKSPGAYTDMDIDCDGAGAGTGDCSNDQSGQSITAWADQVKQMSGGAIEDLNAHIHTYVVFGNESPKFDATEHGIEPLSVMAVVCNGQVIMGIMGDSNGAGLVGEAAISTAKLCFPNEKITGDSGHGEKDVLYIAFPGKAAVPKDAKWDAKDAAVFEESLWATGAPLLETLGSGGSGNGTTASAASGTTPKKSSKTQSAGSHATPTSVDPEEGNGEGSEEDNEPKKEKNKEKSKGGKKNEENNEENNDENDDEEGNDENEEKRSLFFSRIFRGRKY